MNTEKIIIEMKEIFEKKDINEFDIFIHKYSELLSPVFVDDWEKLDEIHKQMQFYIIILESRYTSEELKEWAFEEMSKISKNYYMWSPVEWS